MNTELPAIQKDKSLPQKAIGFCLLLISLFAGWLWMDYQSLIDDPVITGETVNLEINKGDSFNVITDRLLAKGVAINPFWFKLLAYRQGVINKLKAGEYELPPGTTTAQLLNLFVAGRSRQYSITFPEGWTFRQMLTLIEHNPHITRSLDDLDGAAIMKTLSAAEKYPEGLFFPDTYFFDKNTTDLSLLRRAYEKMHGIISREWPQRDKGLPLETPYQAMILASIVEKETADAGERRLIAGVFIRRLQKGMLLQTDPTVIYGMGDRYQGNIRYKDLATATPYNTYIIQGLPPTPICLPGLAAIRAVLHPQPGKSLYFVSRGDGSHVFSTTLAEHNRAVNRFQRKKP